MLLPLQQNVAERQIGLNKILLLLLLNWTRSTPDRPVMSSWSLSQTKTHGAKLNKQCTVQGTGRVPDTDLRIGFQYMTAHCAQQLAKELRQTGTCAKASMWHIQPELVEAAATTF